MKLLHAVLDMMVLAAAAVGIVLLGLSVIKELF